MLDAVEPLHNDACLKSAFQMQVKSSQRQHRMARTRALSALTY